MKTIQIDNLYRASEMFDKAMPKTQWLIDERIPYGSLSALVGESGVGKSTFLRQLAIAIASGKNSFLNFKLNPKFKKVLYISTEDGYTFTHAALMKQLHMTPDRFDDKGILKEKDDCLNNIFFLFDHEQIIDKLRHILKEEDFDLIIVDAYSDIFLGDMNQSNQVRTFLSYYTKLASEYGIAILFMHHFGKGMKSNDKHKILGSAGFEQKMRSVLSLSRKDNQIHLQTIKNNYLSQAECQMAFHLEMGDDLTFTVVDSFHRDESRSGGSNTKVYTLLNEYTNYIKNLKSGHLNFEIIRNRLEEEHNFKVSVGTLHKAVKLYQEE
jgi:RecA-family ATPase